MASIHPIRPRRKKKVLGRGKELSREDYEAMELDGRVSAIRSLVQLGLIQVYEELDREVESLAGRKHSRKDPQRPFWRGGSNPGTVELAGQRVPVRVTRVRGRGGEVRLSSYDALHQGTELDETLFRRVLYGISCRNYEAAAEAIPGAIGLSRSTVSRKFIEASTAKLRELQERDLSAYDIVTVFLDGKSFSDDELVLAIGVTISGEKVLLGFVETASENTAVITSFLRSLKDRGLDTSEGVLVVIDGSRGFRSAVKKAFRKTVLVQRCQWHKRENVVRHLPKEVQGIWRSRLQKAYGRPTYAEAKKALDCLLEELEEINQSAAGSLREGLEETLTLHKLGVFARIGVSLKTTNCIESTFAQVEAMCGKVDTWKNSSQKQRWFAAAVLDIEPRWRKIRGYRQLPVLRVAIQRELKIETERQLKKPA